MFKILVQFILYINSPHYRIHDHFDDLTVRFSALHLISIDPNKYSDYTSIHNFLVKSSHYGKLAISNQDTALSLPGDKNFRCTRAPDIEFSKALADPSILLRAMPRAPL